TEREREREREVHACLVAGASGERPSVTARGSKRPPQDPFPEQRSRRENNARYPDLRPCEQVGAESTRPDGTKSGSAALTPRRSRNARKAAATAARRARQAGTAAPAL